MEFIDRKKKESDELFEKMKSMYYIPDKYRDCSSVFFKDGFKKLKLKSKRYKVLKELIDDWNSMYDEMQYKVPKKVGEELEKNFSDSNYILGIHRTDLSLSDVQKKIYTNGLKNRSTEYSSTVQSFNYFPFLLREIIKCNGYKWSQGCVIVKFPKNPELPIYYVGDNGYYILPEYIYGYVEVNDEKITKFDRNPGYKDVHNYEPNGLEYDEDLARRR